MRRGTPFLPCLPCYISAGYGLVGRQPPGDRRDETGIVDSNTSQPRKSRAPSTDGSYQPPNRPQKISGGRPFGLRSVPINADKPRITRINTDNMLPGHSGTGRSPTGLSIPIRVILTHPRYSGTATDNHAASTSQTESNATDPPPIPGTPANLPRTR